MLRYFGELVEQDHNQLTAEIERLRAEVITLRRRLDAAEYRELVYRG